jgi:hypothetical protein
MDSASMPATATNVKKQTKLKKTSKDKTRRSAGSILTSS